MKITPVMVVEDIESALPFWVDRLGFTKTVEVPDGDRLGFVILVQDGAELMLQTADSVRKDSADFIPSFEPGGTGLFVEVSDFPSIVASLTGYPIALPERTTFYGMREIGVHAPGGYPVIFAAHA